ncbi:hypothetical protein NFI95_14215 [Acetobacteraceae bacterium KSS8]|uniref:Glycosyltransferase n=1 Tax=Endosaccharibacter trunci TaxID=2812733 RepID=A0ABT1W9N3_9PROT|nr:hypothetical protein [Acetobacteraceae bacterium KSS8]
MPEIARCPICRNAGWHDRSAFLACTHCELEVSRDHPLDAMPGQIEDALDGAGRDALSGPGWRLSAVALRNAAWRLGRSWRAGGWRREAPVAHAVVLGVIGRPQEMPVIETMMTGPGFPRAIVVLDGDGEAPQGPAGMRVSMRPLAGDFAAQRNQVQSLAQRRCGARCWVLQLDTDERPTPELLGRLGWMIQAADREGLRSIGLPRINLVDGARSALFPDIQYRLNRADVRFDGIVHERPVVAFAETTLGLAGAIEHRLSRERVLERSRSYETMRAGAGRPSDEWALLRPFDPASMAVR